MKKIYIITPDDANVVWRAELEVTYPDGERVAAACNEFFSDWERRLSLAEGDPVLAFVILLTPVLMSFSSRGLSLKGIIREFERLEGYPNLTGHTGLKLIECARYEFPDSFEVQVNTPDRENQTFYFSTP